MYEVNPFRGSAYISAISGILGIWGKNVLFLGVYSSNFPKFPSLPMVQVWEHGEYTAPISPNSPSEIGESTEKPLKSQG